MLSTNSTASPTTQHHDLAALAQTVRASLQASANAAANFLEHVMAAGDALIVAKEKAGAGNWLKFLRGCDLSEDRAERYMRLARGRAQLDSARMRNLSVNAALKILKPAPAPGKRVKKGTAAPPALNVLAWDLATADQRRRFVDGIGLKPLLSAFPPTWREGIAKQSAPPALASVAWFEASREERRQFLEAVGVTSLWAALSDSMEHEIGRRLAAKVRAAKRQKPADQPIGDGLDIPASLRRASPTSRYDLELAATKTA